MKIRVPCKFEGWYIWIYIVKDVAGNQGGVSLYIALGGEGKTVNLVPGQSPFGTVEIA